MLVLSIFDAGRASSRNALLEDGHVAERAAASPVLDPTEIMVGLGMSLGRALTGPSITCPTSRL